MRFFFLHIYAAIKFKSVYLCVCVSSTLLVDKSPLHWRCTYHTFMYIKWYTTKPPGMKKTKRGNNIECLCICVFACVCGEKRHKRTIKSDLLFTARPETRLSGNMWTDKNQRFQILVAKEAQKKNCIGIHINAWCISLFRPDDFYLLNWEWEEEAKHSYWRMCVRAWTLFRTLFPSFGWFSAFVHRTLPPPLPSHRIDIPLSLWMIRIYTTKRASNARDLVALISMHPEQSG